MTPQEQAALRGLLESQSNQSKVISQLTALTSKVAMENAVLIAAIGALFAELAKAHDGQASLDAMLERFSGAIEGLPNADGNVLRTADDIRGFAETLV